MIKKPGSLRTSDCLHRYLHGIGVQLDPQLLAHISGLGFDHGRDHDEPLRRASNSVVVIFEVIE